jgi:hypothetical protein
MNLCARKTMQLFNTPEHTSMYLSLAALRATPMKHVNMSHPLYDGPYKRSTVTKRKILEPCISRTKVPLRYCNLNCTDSGRGYMVA